MCQRAISVLNFKNGKEIRLKFFQTREVSVHSRVCQYGFAFPCTVRTTELPASKHTHTHTHTHKHMGVYVCVYVYIYISSHKFLATFATNSDTWFFDITCFQQLKLVSDSTSQYLHVQNKECEQFRFVSNHVRFLCISHEFDTYKLFIDLVTCVLIAKE